MSAGFAPDKAERPYGRDPAGTLLGTLRHRLSANSQMLSAEVVHTPVSLYSSKTIRLAVATVWADGPVFELQLQRERASRTQRPQEVHSN